jgi:hypothetical protein
MRVLAEGSEVDGIRLIIPQKLEQGDVAVREIDVAASLRGKDYTWWQRHLFEEIGGEWNVNRDGEFLQFDVPLGQLLDAMGRATWLKKSPQSTPVDPITIGFQNPTLELPVDDPISDYRRNVLLQAADNLQTLIDPQARISTSVAEADLPPEWIRKSKTVIAVLKPEIPHDRYRDNYFQALIKLGLIEIPLHQPVHHAPTTEFNPAVKLHNSIMKTTELIKYSETDFPETEKINFPDMIQDFPLERLGRESDLRLLARALLRLAIELPELTHPARFSRIMTLLHENTKALNGLWTNTRIIVPEDEESTCLRLHLLKSRQYLLSQILSALTNTYTLYSG